MACWCPSTARRLYIDLFARWRLPVVLCARTALGTINHSLLSIEALRSPQDRHSRDRLHRRRECRIPRQRFANGAGAQARTIALAFTSRLRPTLAICFRRSLQPSMISIDDTHTRMPIWHPFTQHALQREMTKIAAAKEHISTPPTAAVSSMRFRPGGSSRTGIVIRQIVSAIQEQAERLNQIIFAGIPTSRPRSLPRKLLEIDAAGISNTCSFPIAARPASRSRSKWRSATGITSASRAQRIVVMQHSYHGDTIGAMSVGARGVFNAAYEPLLFEVDHDSVSAPGHEQATLDALEAACRSEKSRRFHRRAVDPRRRRHADISRLGA